jgi:hypothetical protein
MAEVVAEFSQHDGEKRGFLFGFGQARIQVDFPQHELLQQQELVSQQRVSWFFLLKDSFQVASA